MAPRVTHAKVSGQPAGTNPNKVYGTHWDADHVVTGLENVDNTSDLNKPISTATQAALDAKQPLDTDLTTIAALSTTGILRRTGSGTWSLGTAVANSELATMATYTIKGNATGSTAAPTDISIAALTTKATPVSGDYVLLSDGAASGALKKANVTSFGAVSSIAGNTGAFTLSTGITNSTNDIRLDRGQLPGTTTNDNANSGNIGEYISIDNGGGASPTCTITIAAPAVITATHLISVGGGVNSTIACYFTTTGALPTGITANTVYYAHVVNSTTLNIATTASNALAGTYITTSGSQSGTHTLHTNAIQLTTNTPINLAAVAIPAGDWDMTGGNALGGNITTTVDYYVTSIGTTSGSLNQVINFYGKGLGMGSGTPFSGGGEYLTYTGFGRASLSGSTNYYLVTQVGFGTSFAQINTIGIRARRVR